MLLLPLLIACSPIQNPAPDDVVAAQLKAFTISGGATVAPETGDLAVTGSGSDFTLTLNDLERALHSPGGSALDALNGTTATLSISPASDEWVEEYPAVIEDEVGVVWIAQPGASGALAESYFGAGFASYGQTLGQARSGDYAVDYQTVVFATDDGDVEARAGEPVTLHLGGLSYRSTVITAYTTEQIPGTPQYDCMGMPDLLSFEMFRVEEEQTWSKIVRPTDLDAALIPGCGAE